MFGSIVPVLVYTHICSPRECLWTVTTFTMSAASLYGGGLLFLKCWCSDGRKKMLWFFSPPRSGSVLVGLFALIQLPSSGCSSSSVQRTLLLGSPVIFLWVVLFWAFLGADRGAKEHRELLVDLIKSCLIGSSVQGCTYILCSSVVVGQEGVVCTFSLFWWCCLVGGCSVLLFCFIVVSGGRVWCPPFYSLFRCLM